MRAIQTKFQLSERRACELVGVGRSTCRYRTRRPDWPVLRERLQTLAGPSGGGSVIAGATSS